MAAHRIITLGVKPCRLLLKLKPFADLFFSRHYTCVMRIYISIGLRRRGGNISVDLSLFVLLYNTHFMNKPKFNDFLYN